MTNSPIVDAMSALLQPSPSIIVLTLLIALSIPLFLHFVIYRSSISSTLPSFLLIGPSGSGKTSFLTLLERGTSSTTTHTSQTPLSVELSLPVSTRAASARFRSVNDPSNQTHKKFLLLDTPGHGKLRHHALDSLLNPSHLKGLIFLVDAANLTTGSAGLREAAEYLHDTLLLVQKRATTGSSKGGLKGLQVLVAANKLDLFTALPAGMVKRALEGEISKVRDSRAKGLLDSGVGMDDLGAETEREWLGEGGEGSFQFKQMAECGIEIAVEGGVVVGAEGSDVEKWWQWIGDCL